MLVLTRKKGESIMIGDQIEVVVLGVEGEQVRLGIRAPQSVQVFRQELYAAIKQSNREAMNSSLDLRDMTKFGWKAEE